MRRLLAAAALLSGFAFSQAAAQREPARSAYGTSPGTTTHIAPTLPPSAPLPTDALHAPILLAEVAQASRPSKRPYLLAGALTGVAAAALTLWATEPAEATTSLWFVIGVSTMPSAVIGAAVGWLVYEVRH